MTAARASQIPLSVHDLDGRGFSEPWQVEAMCIAIAASKEHVFTWTEWVEQLSKLRDIENHRKDDIETVYYQDWLATLERMLSDRKLVSHDEIEKRVEEWRLAYLRTPHGHPVELLRGQLPVDCMKASREPDHDVHVHSHDHHHHRHDHDHDHDHRAQRPRLRPQPISISPATS